MPVDERDAWGRAYRERTDASKVTKQEVGATAAVPGLLP